MVHDTPGATEEQALHPLAVQLLARIEQAQGQLVGKLGEIDVALVLRQDAVSAPPIAFHAWHIARFADRTAAALSGAPEYWAQHAVAAAWQLPDVDRGRFETGIGVADGGALGIPGDARLREYVSASFAALHAAATTALTEPEREVVGDGSGFNPSGMRVSQALIGYVSHLSRHLGAIEALVGVAGQRGSVTL